ncbi:alpha/beta hydrolase [Pseudolysinimonas sp.]|uniref:alpha/beta hydrolase n=1 Tax=Pseudolysinimonas sp. TaxID=2680009 RepID=UPI003F7DB815
MTLSPPRRARSRVALVLALVALAAVLALGVLLAIVLLADPAHPSAWQRAVLATPIISGPLPLVLDLVALAALAAVLIRRWTVPGVVLVVVAAVLGAGIAVVVLHLAQAQDWFGVGLDGVTQAWVIAVFAAVGAALGALPWARAWRRVLVPVAVLAAVAAGTVGVNAHFGIQPTLAAFAGVSLEKPVKLPLAGTSASPSASATPLAGGALWANWHAPADLPSSGTTGTVDIPAPVSGFHARPAGLYLPPAALVKNPPALPLVIMMMGQPGDPDPAWAANSLNPFAARHDGLAPIVVVADQLGGDKSVDNLCLDTARHGKVMTYITQDVLPWARSHLHVLQDAAHTVVAGYSNGGECAVSFGARFPQLWSNVLDISGEAYPGADRAAATLRTEFGGDAAAYRATWPATILAAGHYPDEFGVFTAGAEDPFYRGQAAQMVTATKAAGWQSEYIEIPHQGHLAGAVRGGLDDGFTALYPRLGLSQPGTTP